MASIMWNLILASALLFVADYAHGYTEVIDTETDNIELIAKALCHESIIKRIGRQSTIGQLADYFNSLSPESELSACGNQYIEPLKDLKAVLGASSEDVCSKAKLEQINKFHWDYIVGTLSRKWSKASEKRLPEPLRLFFMHYANEITEKCKETLLERLELTSDGNSPPLALLSDESGGSFIDMTKALIPANKVTNYDSFYFILNQILIKERKKGRTYEPPVDELTKEPVQALVMINDPNKAWAIQDQCRLELRPIYQETVLPVMRLLEMGYGKVSEQSKEIFRDHKLIRDWYAVTQLCELFVPVNFYKDSLLKEGQATIITADRMNEVKDLGRSAAEVRQVDAIQMDLKIKSTQLNDLLESADNNQIVGQVRSNLDERNQVLRQIFKNMFSSMMSKFLAKLKNFFLFWRKKDNKYVKESGDKMIKESEAEIKKLLDDDDLGTESKLSRRIKRETKEERSDRLEQNAISIFGIVMLILAIIVIPIIILG